MRGKQDLLLSQGRSKVYKPLNKQQATQPQTPGHHDDKRDDTDA